MPDVTKQVKFCTWEKAALREAERLYEFCESFDPRGFWAEFEGSGFDGVPDLLEAAQNAVFALVSAALTIGFDESVAEYAVTQAIGASDLESLVEDYYKAEPGTI